MITSRDRTTLRDLAKQVADVASLSVQAERRRLWKEHNRLHPTRPMILLFPEGSWEELLPERDMSCEGTKARLIERELRRRICHSQHFDDDTVLEREWVVLKVIHDSGWGLEVKRIPSTAARGSWKFDPVITRPADLKKLRYPEIRYDEAVTKENFAEAQELFGDILDVRLRGVARVSYN